MSTGHVPPPRPGAVTLNEVLHRRAVELLEGKGWVDLEPVLRELIKLVPPGIAMRKTEDDRVRNVGSPKPRVRYQDTEDLVRTGARAYIRSTVLKVEAYEMRWLNDRLQQIQLVYLPRSVRGDRMRGQVILPVLNQLVRGFLNESHKEAAHQVQLAAHEEGLHLAYCRPGCTLGTREFNLEAGDVVYAPG